MMVIEVYYMCLSHFTMITYSINNNRLLHSLLLLYLLILWMNLSLSLSLPIIIYLQSALAQNKRILGINILISTVLINIHKQTDNHTFLVLIFVIKNGETLL